LTSNNFKASSLIFSTRSVRVWTTIPSTTGVAQEAIGISAPWTSTRQIRQDLSKLNLG
jgi:hypothetical protein